MTTLEELNQIVIGMEKRLAEATEELTELERKVRILEKEVSYLKP